MMSINSNFFFRFVLSALIFLIVFLPGGSLGNINLKVVLSALLIVFFSFHFYFKRSVEVDTIKLIYLFLFSVFFVLVWVFIAIIYGQQIVNEEVFLFFTFFLINLIVIASITEKLISPLAVHKVIMYSAIFFSTVKLFILISVLGGFFDLGFVSSFIKESFNVFPMLLPLGSDLTRFQLANDFIVVFVLYFMVTMPKNFFFINRFFYAFFLIILLLSCFFAFSRYIFFVLFFGFFLYIFFVESSFKKYIIYFSFSLIILLFYYMFDSVVDLIEIRFFSTNSDSSDSLREVQISCLLKSFSDAIFFGHGVGTFDASCPANEDAPYAYEVQYFGFLYKFGLIGVFFLILLYLSYYKSFISTGYRKSLIPVYFCLFLWLLVGFFNPYLISAYASLIIIISLVNSKILDSRVMLVK